MNVYRGTYFQFQLKNLTRLVLNQISQLRYYIRISYLGRIFFWLFPEVLSLQSLVFLFVIL